MSIGFLGAGAIGSLFGGYLATIQSDRYLPEIIFFCRREHAEAINNKGLILDKNEEKILIKSIKAFINLEDFRKSQSSASGRRFDYLFLTTKTYDITSAITEYKELIESCVKFIVLQNGIGNEDLMEKLCSKEKIIRIITTNGALLESVGHVRHTGKGYTKMGYILDHPKDLYENLKGKRAREIIKLGELLNIAGLDTFIVEDIQKECWEKMFVNAGINAFGALTGLKNGDLLKVEGLKLLMKEAINEAIKVAEMKKIKLNKNDFVSLAYEVAEKTAENKNSMLQDVLKRKKTEIDFINGKIVDYAKELGVHTPVNEAVTYLVKGLEYSFY